MFNPFKINITPSAEALCSIPGSKEDSLSPSLAISFRNKKKVKCSDTGLQSSIWEAKTRRRELHKKVEEEEEEEEKKGKEDEEGTTDHLPLNTRSFAFKIKIN